MLLRQTALYLPAQMVGPLAQVVAAVTWTHWLAPGPYGLLTFLVAGQDLVFMVCVSWWTHYTMRYFGGLGGADRARFATSEAPVFALILLFQVAGTIVVLGLLHEPPSWPLAGAAMAYVTTRSLLVHLGERARTQRRIAAYTLGQAGGSLGGFLLALLAVSRIAATPEAALLGFAAAQLVSLIALWRLLGITRGALVPDRAILAAALAFGAPLVVAGGLSWLGQNGIRIVVESMAGLDALGLIAVGWGLGQRLAATLAMVVTAAAFPLAVASLHEGSRIEAYRHLWQGALLLVGLILPAAIGLALLAEPLASAFIASPYRATTIAILPYAAAAGAVRNIRMHGVDPVFLLMEKSTIATLVNVIDVACVMAGCIVGLAAFGLVGAVAGCLVGTTLGTLAGFGLAWRLAGYTLPSGDCLRIVGAGAVMTAALTAIPWHDIATNPGARIAAESAIGALVYGAALVLLYPAALRRIFAAR